MPNHSIFAILKELSPESWPGGAPPLIVARPQIKQMRQETDLPLIPRKSKGTRKVVRSFNFSY